jgi:hypothetical protein
MIKVVFVFIVLLLSAIFAYLALSNRKDSSKELPQSKTTQNQEDEDTSSTSNAQPIETEPPEEKEDPGTCETTGDWAMSGECQADGTAIFTQTYKESKPGACPSNEKARVKPCCYQKGDWVDITGCDEGGRKTQEQTTVNCASSVKTRREYCKYIGPWTKMGECNEMGKQLYTRVVTNGTGEPMSKYLDCCYKGGWKDKECHKGDRKLQFRENINCPSSDNETRWVEFGCKYVSRCTSTRNKCGEVNPVVTCDSRTGCLPYE